ncbi:MAG TPA: TonB-dependent receptor plug domain-containing protein [Opitutaceae bacterium]
MSYRMKSAGSVLAALLTVAVPKIWAQAAPAANTNNGSQDETIVLSPFVVDASEDTGSYSANSTLAGTRVRTDLKDVASSITVVTQKFLQDTAAHNAQQLLGYQPNTEIGGLQGNFSGQAGNAQYDENTLNPSSNTRVRGLDTADNTRDYFITDIPFDTFNTGRIDLQRGPNSILFGVGSPAGIINASLNEAGFKNSINFEDVVGSYGSWRNSADVNRVLIPDVLAIRLSAVIDDQRYQEKPAYNDTTRQYAALRFDPKLKFLGESSHTSIRAKYEHGKVSSDNPRSLPPVDEITPWFTGLNGSAPKPTLNQYAPGANDSSSSVANIFNSNLGGFAQGRTYWADALSYYDNGSTTPMYIKSGQNSQGYGISSSGTVDKSISGAVAYRPVGIPDYNLYAANNSSIPGGAYYADKVLTDPSIYNFYDNLLDGYNSHQEQKWRAYNIALDQTFLDDRIAFEVALDHQRYDTGQVNFLSGVNYAINVDPNVTLPDGSPNPNLGRPYVASSTNSGGDSFNSISRLGTRYTLTGDLRASDFFGQGTLSYILGHHVFTGLIDREQRKSKLINFVEYAADQDYATFLNAKVQPLNNERQFDWINYIGPSLQGASSASGANISRINQIIAPAASTSVFAFNSKWNKPTDPTAAGYVDPSAPYTYVAHGTGQTVTSTQSENPDNYVGWQNTTVNWLSYKNPADFPQLVSGGQITDYRDLSRGLTWQGYFLGGDLVPVYGWRRDSIVNHVTVAPYNSTTGMTSLDYSEDPLSRTTQIGQSRSWGGVYHLPKALKLPLGSTISFFYDHSNNFKGDAPRFSLEGDPIPNPRGVTRDYGVTVTTLDDKISLKVTRYHTIVNGATFDVTNGNSIAGLGGNGYWLWAAPTWGYFWATQLQDGLEGRTPGNQYYNYAANASPNSWNSNGAVNTADNNASGGYGTPGWTNSPETAFTKTIVNAWLNDLPLADHFYTYYGIHPVTITPSKAKATGELRDAMGPGYNDANADPGTGSQQPGGINAVSTVDTISKGTEIELSAQPTKNWNLTVNYSHTNATRTNIDPATTKFMSDLYTFFTGPGGQIREWGPGGNPIGKDWITNVYNPYEVEVLSAGQQAPEIAPWRLNGITTYTFDHGPAKGFLIGGAIRWEAAIIAGYRYNADLGPTGSLDPNDPIKGKEEKHYDLWVGYSRKVYKNINWRIQLNLRDIGDKAHLVPSRIEPDGSLALARIEEGTSWQLTNSFDF